MRRAREIFRRLHSTATGIVVLASWLLMPAAASAQSAIAGQAKDNSGAVLPGVTVEVSDVPQTVLPGRMPRVALRLRVVTDH